VATILLIVLVLLLIGALPSWPYSTFHGVAGLTFHASRPWHLASCPPFHGDPARRGACQTWPGHITDGPPDGPDFPSTSNGTTTTCGRLEGRLKTTTTVCVLCRHPVTITDWEPIATWLAVEGCPCGDFLVWTPLWGGRLATLPDMERQDLLARIQAARARAMRPGSRRGSTAGS
jgi:hypothetical protein